MLQRRVIPDVSPTYAPARASTEPLNCFSGEYIVASAFTRVSSGFNGAAELLQRRGQFRKKLGPGYKELQRSRRFRLHSLRSDVEQLGCADEDLAACTRGGCSYPPRGPATTLPARTLEAARARRVLCSCLSALARRHLQPIGSAVKSNPRHKAPEVGLAPSWAPGCTSLRAVLARDAPRAERDRLRRRCWGTSPSGRDGPRPSNERCRRRTP